MARDSLVGSRIRERRVMNGMRQAELATRAEISASYLNLIEHNKRRIGGKLLVNIAAALGVETSVLSEGAEAALIATLREAAATSGKAAPELDRVDEFAGRFPGWAEALAEQHKQVQSLERTVQSLTDRLAHDPHLATSMHELLTMVTAIRSTAGILHENDQIEPEWQGRFHRNLNEDSVRLADSAQTLVDYLDGQGDKATQGSAPQEELDAFLKDNNYHFSDLETASGWPEDVVNAAPSLTSLAARDMARRYLDTYQADAKRLPRPMFLTAIEDLGLKPDLLAQRFDVSLSTILRRCAAMPDEALPSPVGLVVCDGSGALLFRRQLSGFALPRFSAACAKWPLFKALSQPMQPVRAIVEMAGRDAEQFECLAIADRISAVSFDKTPLYNAYMLILPRHDKVDEPRRVGSSCRICPRAKCEGRNMPSILAQGI